MKKYFIFVVSFQLFCSLLTSSQAATTDGRLHEFTTDGCSGGAPNEITLDKKYNWMKCCIAHDTEYWIGGSPEDKKKADAELSICVGQKFNPFVGELYETGVTVGGSPELPTTWRWGYGWSKRSLWRVRSEDEQKKIDELKTKIWSLQESVTPNLTDLYRKVISCVDAQSSKWSFVISMASEQLGEGIFKTYPKNSAPIQRTCHSNMINSTGITSSTRSLIVNNFEPKIKLKEQTEIDELTFNLINEPCTTKKDNEQWPMSALYTLQNKMRTACCEMLEGGR